MNTIDDKFFLGNKESIFECQPKLCVCVHPFYGYTDKIYDSKMKSFLKNEEVPIIILEKEENLLSEDSTYDLVKKLDPLGPRYFLPTFSNNPEPKLEGGWENVKSIIKKVNPNELIFTGALLLYAVVSGHNRCVGVAYNNLKDLAENSGFDLDLCKEDRTPYAFRSLQDVITY